MVNDEHQDRVVETAKNAGATGVTILNSRGESIRAQKFFFGLNVEVQREVFLFLVEDFNCDKIIDAILKAGQFKKSGIGIAFSLMVERAIGLDSQMSALKEDSQK